MDKIFEFIKKDIENTRFYKFKLPFFVILIYLLVYFLLEIFDKNINYKDFNFIGNLILLMTFGALIWYSFETRELKLSSQFTNELEQKPIIDLICNSKGDFVLKNSGKGVAYNIEFEFTGFDQKKVIFTYKFRSRGPNVILFPNEERQLDLIEYENDSCLRGGGLALEKLKNIISSNYNNLFGNPQFFIYYKNALKKYKREFKFCFNEVNERLEAQPFKIVFVE